MEKVTEQTKWVPMINSFVEPDGWKIGGKLVGSKWEKAMFYIESGTLIGITYPINISIVESVKTRIRRNNEWRRVNIEWLKDGEPSQFSRGWMIGNKIGREIEPLPMKGVFQ